MLCGGLTAAGFDVLTPQGQLLHADRQPQGPVVDRVRVAPADRGGHRRDAGDRLRPDGRRVRPPHRLRRQGAPRRGGPPSRRAEVLSSCRATDCPRWAVRSFGRFLTEFTCAPPSCNKPTVTVRGMKTTPASGWSLPFADRLFHCFRSAATAPGAARARAAAATRGTARRAAAPAAPARARPARRATRRRRSRPPRCRRRPPTSAAAGRDASTSGWRTREEKIEGLNETLDRRRTRR